MIDLQKTSGLPIEVKEDCLVKFNPPMTDREPTYVREISKILPVLMNPNAKPLPAFGYTGYRGLYLPQDQELVEGHHLQYDLTIIPPLMLGDELNKTLGHYHAAIPGTQIAHPEIYEVLAGTALFLIQEVEEDFKTLKGVYGFEIKTGEKVIYPPGVGHIIVNIGNDFLVTANWLCSDYKPLYEPLADMHGMGYYVVKKADGYAFVQNSNYKQHPEVQMLNNKEKIASHFGFKSDEPMYTTFINDPKKLDFLINPQAYLSQLADLTK